FLSIPPNPDQPRMIPESLDPPDHRRYRQLLRPFFESKAIAPLEARVTEWTDELLAKVPATGECEFVSAVASRLPVAVFMELFAFPMEKFADFRKLVVAFFSSRASIAERQAYAFQIMAPLGQLIQDRTAEPRDAMTS